MNDQISSDTIAIVDSFPYHFVSLFATIEQVFSKEWQTLATMRQNTYGSMVTKFTCSLPYLAIFWTYIVTSASVHDIKAVEDLLEGCQQSVILADLGYLSQALKDRLKQRGYHLWTPLRQNMEGASQHNNWRLLAMRRTIETRFSELCALFDMEHTFARGVAGLQLRIEQILLAYNLSYFELN